MNEHTTKSSPGGSGRMALWIVLALALAALAYLTLGLAIPNNPLYSDRDSNGISKYQFLEHCQEQIAQAPEMGEIRSALVAQNMLGEDDSLRSEMLLDSEELVDSISVSTEPGQSWTLGAPVRMRSQLTGKPLLQVYSQCHYDREAGHTVVTLQPM
ncbi:hypothetical protein GCM10017783_16000 [Deinococcus piscis]|uniref:Uncharacterized protein n=1 Tax=Deinococcus piscis TaxID=394230 RepID=A0ABQ3K5R2_9DEIO|nr:hypothetical protein [Deinococcus piscis]GHG04164.1 hypothetical protein GCM10017783_16000 [Deinococcus piscis]